ncbi:MAG: hypothetical protein Q7T72_09140 [Bacteroidales bacterium]|nr:hypothetical protein [Bacteroidales bacterium]
MRIEQLQFFQKKGDFYSPEFEDKKNTMIFSKIGLSVQDAFDKFSQIDITPFDSTTRANMLNNLVVNRVNHNCDCDKFRFYDSLTNTRRSFGILDDKYIFLFKKSPISNIKTNQDDLIKNQELDMHVIFVVYKIDEFWSSITGLEFQYYSSANNLIYSYDISDYLNSGESRMLFPTNDPTQSIKIKKEKLPKRKAE